jgi:dTDP-glucose 4,6-dehydratase
VKKGHYLVTGGAGFLGSHLCDALLDRGHRVTCVDNFLTGSPSNIAHLAGHERFRFIKHDVSQDLYLPDAVDGVLHFASPASPRDYLEFPFKRSKSALLGHP